MYNLNGVKHKYLVKYYKKQNYNYKSVISISQITIVS